MKKLIYYTVFLFSSSLLAQTNLVPNGGFEEYIECPSNDPGNADVHLAEPWIGYSADFMHTCAGISTLVPETSYSSPRNGEGYIRIGSYRIHTYNFREYIEVPLTESLEVGEAYCVEYYCKLYRNRGIGVDGMGAFFTVDFAEWEDIIYSDWPIGEPVPDVDIIADAQVISDVIHNDTLNYTLVSGSFVAQEPYSYVTIGNFVNDEKLNTENILDPLPDWGGGASYAIDDISIYKCSVDLDEQELESIQKAYPVVGGIQLKHVQNPVTIYVYNVQGSLIAHKSVSNDLFWDLSDLPAGMYVYQLSDPTGKRESGKLLCH